MLSIRTPWTLACGSFTFVLFVLCLSSSSALSQTAPQPQGETWFGWMESPKRQLRTIVRVNRDETGAATSGSMVSPDESLKEIALNQFEIKANGDWQFELVDPIASQSVKFSGVQTSPEQVTGKLEQSGEALSLNLQKVGTLPPETRSDLGADSVWLGTLDFVVKKLDFRIRVYSSPPFASESAPRFLFDSLTQNVPGIPAQFTAGADGQTTLEMKTIGAKYIGLLNETGDELDGRYIQNSQPLKLVFRIQRKEPRIDETAKKDSPAQKNPLVEKNPIVETGPIDTAVTIDKKSKAENSIQAIQSDKTDKTNQTELSDRTFVEVPFEVTYGAKPMKGKDPKTADPGIRLAGTITIPKQRNKEQPTKFPTVVMVTGSGPQDRNGTVGRHQPYQKIAHYLAENGIASLRYDDRGVGASTGDFLNATTEDFARDAISVWKHAQNLVELDPTRIGMLGHSEGGVIGTISAVWEPDIAFLILLAPHGVNGSDLLKSQIDRISELQGMSESDRKVTMALQGRLQDIAGGYFSDENSMRRDIQAAIRDNWDGLKRIAKSQDPNADLEAIRKGLTAQIEGQFQQLHMPWYRFFLNYDPSPNWMMMRCPTLAMWGSKDVQVLPELNRDKLKVALDRNSELDAQLSILPGLNHLLQACATGLPEEYDMIDEAISPTVLNTMRLWMEQNGFVDKP